MGDNSVSGFLLGFIAGCIFMSVVGLIVNIIRWHWKRVEAIGKPQFVNVPTKKSPGQVWAEGCESLLVLLFIIIAVIVLVAFFLATTRC